MKSSLGYNDEASNGKVLGIDDGIELGKELDIIASDKDSNTLEPYDVLALGSLLGVTEKRNK